MGIWPDMDLLLEREGAPEVVLVPDGAFPVVVGEKGLLTVEWEASWTAEPTRDGLRFIGLRAGTRHNVVPESARLWFACEGGIGPARRRLEKLPHVAEVAEATEPPPVAGDAPYVELRFQGKACHGAFPHQGHNAALDALQALHSLCGDRGVGAFAAFLLRHATDLEGAGIGLDRSHVRMGGNTLNLGVVEAGPGHGHALVNIRFPAGSTVADIQRRSEEASRAAEIRVTTTARGRPQEPLYVSPEDHPRLIRALQTAYRCGTGRQPYLASIPGTTYAKVFPLAVAFGPQDPSAGEAVLAHQPDERVSEERLLENIRVYALALALLAFDPDDLRQVKQCD